MGNLCSSGAEREKTSKKEENLPDKPRNGEDEALLAAGAQDEQGKVESGGLGGLVSGVGDAIGEVSETAQTEAKQLVEDAKAKGETEVKATVEDVKATGEEKVKAVVEEVKETVSSAVGSVTEQAAQNVQQVTEQTAQEVNKVDEKVQSEASNANDLQADFSDAVEQTKKDLQSAGQESSAQVSEAVQSVKEEATASADETSKTSVSFADQIQSGVSGLVEGGKEMASEKAQEAQTAASTAAEEGKAFVQEQISKGQEAVSSLVEEGAQNVSQFGQGLMSQGEESLEQAKSETESAASELKSESEASATESLDALRSTADQASESVNEAASQAQADVNNAVSQGIESSEAAAEAASEELAESVSSRKAQGVASLEQVRDAAGMTSQDLFDSVDEAVRQEEAARKEEQEKAFEAQNVSVAEGLSNAGAGLSQTVGQGVRFAEDNVREFVEEKQTTFEEKSEEIVSNVVREAQNAISGQQENAENVNEIQALVDNGQAAGEAASAEGECFLDKARGLLEAHRNSLDGNKVPDVSEPQGDEAAQPDAQQQPTDEQTEATAREFVDTIIEKATAIVAAEGEGAAAAGGEEDVAQESSEPSVERGEETIPTKKRGVCFASPSPSSGSSTTPDFSPPPPVGEDLSPPSGSITSPSDSASPGESGSDFSAPRSNYVEDNGIDNNNFINNNDNNNSSSVLDNNNTLNGVTTSEDETYIQRVAMEVTSKAVHEAIKIVTENGTGGLSSPSSVERDGVDGEESEMTTTDSSQVERGSPVSDITSDISSHADSASESLSSYDPGQAFRQDLVDAAISPLDKNQSDDSSLTTPIHTSHAETPTPTNADASFGSYPEPPLPEPSSDIAPPPPEPLSEEASDSTSTEPLPPPPPAPLEPAVQVPSSLSIESPASVGKDQVQIVINSPDCAHRTQEDSTPEEPNSPTTQTEEALI